MTVLDWSLFGLAALMSAAGLGLVWLSWKRPGRPAVLMLGWGLLAAAVVSGFIANGDRGVAQVFVIAMALVVAGLGLPLFQGISPPRTRARRQASQHPDTVKRPVMASLGGIWTFIICGPVAGAIALYGAAALFRLLRPETGNPATAGVISIIAAVSGWAIVSTILLIEPRAGRRSAYAGAALAAVAAAALV